jgi:ABC-type glycerol-3-phosphate transport system permease component
VVAVWVSHVQHSSPPECTAGGVLWAYVVHPYQAGRFHHLFYTLYTLHPEHSMFFVCFLISYFVRNGFTVDDLGLLLAMAAVIILIMVVIFRAAVRSFIRRLPVL